LYSATIFDRPLEDKIVGQRSAGGFERFTVWPHD
jgi:hypothetical protein